MYRMAMLPILTMIVTASVTVTALSEEAPGATAQEQSSIGVVDGSINPELIPDHIAYATILRFVAKHSNEELIRFYVKQRIFEDTSCSSEVDAVPDDVVEAFIAVAVDYQEKISPLDIEHTEVLKGTRVGDASTVRRAKEQIVIETINSLPERLGSIEHSDRVLLNLANLKQRMTYRSDH